MKRSIYGVVAAALVATGLGTAGPAQAADDRCLAGVTVGSDPYWVEPYLADKALQLPVAVNIDFDLSACSGTTAEVRKVDGSLATTVTLDQSGHTPPPEPPHFYRYGMLTVPLANGDGNWVVTKLTHDGVSRAVNVPFEVRRQVVVTLDQPARTSGNTPTTITGTLKRYNSSGALVPFAGSTVEIYKRPPVTRIATAKTDSTGRYKLSLLFTQNTTLYAQYRDPKPHYYPVSHDVTVRKLLAMSYLTYSKTAKVNTLWKVSGTAYPGKLYTALEIFTGTAWVSAGSAGYTATNGSYARYWKPTRKGNFRLRVVVSGPGLDNSPWNREAVVTVS